MDIIKNKLIVAIYLSTKALIIIATIDLGYRVICPTIVAQVRVPLKFKKIKDCQIFLKNLDRRSTNGYY